MKCFVPSCVSDFHDFYDKENHGPAKNSKHLFPKDSQRRIHWLQAISFAENVEFDINKVNFNIVCLCSVHFDPAAFTVANRRRRLRSDAVPTIFSKGIR